MANRKLSSEEVRVMLREYELLNSRVSAYSQRIFRVVLGLGAGTAAFVWSSIEVPARSGLLGLWASFLLHGATISLLHSHFVILVFKRTLRLIADRINATSSEPLLIWEGRIWLKHWGGLDKVQTPLTRLFSLILAIPLGLVYSYLVPRAADYIRESAKCGHTFALLYTIATALLVMLEVAVPMMLRSKLLKPFDEIEQQLLPKNSRETSWQSQQTK